MVLCPPLKSPERHLNAKPLSVIFSSVFNIYGVLVSSLVISILGYLIFIPAYFSKALKLGFKEFYPLLLKGFILIAVGVTLSGIIKLLFDITGVVELAVALIFVVFILLLIIFMFILKREDLSFIGKMIKKAQKKYFEEF